MNLNNISITTTAFLTAFLIALSTNANIIVDTKINNTAFKESDKVKNSMKMIQLNLTKEEVILSESYRAIALDMDKDTTLSTLEILGMYAETEAEKRKYARKFAKAYYQYTERVLRFQKILNEEKKRLYGHKSMFDYWQQSKPQQPNRLKRLRVAIDLNDCNYDCERSHLATLRLSYMTPSGLSSYPIDFYFKNATNDEIQAWAVKMRINHQHVESGFITLNHAYK